MSPWPLPLVPDRLGTVTRPDDHVIVLFGATGDLAKRKLLPGLFHLASAGLLPRALPHHRLGTGPVRDDRRAVPPPRPRRHPQFGVAKPTGAAWQDFERALSFGAADPDDPSPLLAEVADGREGHRPAPSAPVPPRRAAGGLRVRGRDAGRHRA